MRKLSKILRFAFELYSLPSLIIHELSHVIFIYLTGSKITNFKIDISRFPHEYYIYIECTKSSSKFKTFLRTYSPLVFLALIGLSAFFSTFGLILFVYMLTTLRKGFSLPSDTDIRTFKDFGKEYKLVDDFCDDLYIVCD
jgi:hypothetical protein